MVASSVRSLLPVCCAIGGLGIWGWILLLALLVAPGDAAAAELEPPLAQLSARIAQRTVLSQAEKTWLAAGPTVRFRSTEIPPYCFNAENPEGLAIDYARVICQAFGIKYEFVPYPGIAFTEILATIGSRAGPDVVLSARRNPAREVQAMFSRPYLFSPWVILTRTDTPDYFGSQEDLRGKRVILENGYLIGEKLRADVPGIQFVPVTTTTEALEALATGKGDAFVGSLSQATYLIAQQGLTNIKVAAPTSYPTQGEAMMVRKDWPELVSLINKALRALTVEEKQQLRNRWLSIRFEYGISRTFALGVSAAVLALLAFLAVLWWWNRRLQREVAARRQTEQALRESEGRFRTMFEQNHAAMLVLDPTDGTIVDANAAAVAFYGWSREELLRRKITEINTLSPEEIATELRVAREGQRNYFQFRHRRADGSVRDVEVFTGPVTIDGRPLLHSIIHDITERKEAEEALHESNEKFRAFFERGNVGMSMTQISGPALCNQALCDMLGLTIAELQHVTWQAVTHPEDMEATRRQIELLVTRKQTAVRFTKRYLHKNGSVVWADLSSILRRDAAGQPLHMMSTIVDITERVQAEEALKASLREKDALLKEVHHRVKNNLQIITSLLRLESGRGGQLDTRSVLTEMQGRVRSMALLHESLYRSGTFAAVDLGSYLRQLSSQIFRALVIRPGAIQFHVELATIPVEMDQALPCGLIVNELISNALKHGFPGSRTGEVRIELHRVEGGAAVCLRVTDNGVGLPADFNLNQLQSLGLQLVSDLVTQLNGTLAIGPGPGAVFSVTFTPSHTEAKGSA
jgi:PAS domain S-box-containing protein